MNTAREFVVWLRGKGLASSADAYARVAARWLDDPARLEGAIVDRRLSPNYRHFLAAALRSLARFRGDDALLGRLQGVRLPAPLAREAKEPLTLEGWRTAVEALERVDGFDEASRAAACMVARRGLRCGDVLRLSRQAILDAARGEDLAIEGKGERWQHVSPAPVRACLRALANLSWRGRVRNAVSPAASAETAQATAGRRIRRLFDKAAERIGLPPSGLHPHLLRHTYAAHFLARMQGDPEALFKLQQQMGWARLDTAANYLRRSRREELDAVEAGVLADLGLEDR